jgi:hypothetical protein
MREFLIEKKVGYTARRKKYINPPVEIVMEKKRLSAQARGDSDGVKVILLGRFWR